MMVRTVRLYAKSVVFPKNLTTFILMFLFCGVILKKVISKKSLWMITTIQ